MEPPAPPSRDKFKRPPNERSAATKKRAVERRRSIPQRFRYDSPLVFHVSLQSYGETAVQFLFNDLSHSKRPSSLIQLIRETSKTLLFEKPQEFEDLAIQALISDFMNGKGLVFVIPELDESSELVSYCLHKMAPHRYDRKIRGELIASYEYVQLMISYLVRVFKEHPNSVSTKFNLQRPPISLIFLTGDDASIHKRKKHFDRVRKITTMIEFDRNIIKDIDNIVENKPFDQIEDTKTSPNSDRVLNEPQGPQNIDNLTQKKISSVTKWMIRDSIVQNEQASYVDYPRKKYQHKRGQTTGGGLVPLRFLIDQWGDALAINMLSQNKLESEDKPLLEALRRAIKNNQLLENPELEELLLPLGIHGPFETLGSIIPSEAQLNEVRSIRATIRKISDLIDN